MFNKVKYIAVSSALALMSFGAVAHGGHDHNAVSAGLIHLAWLAPLLIIGAFLSYRAVKNKLDQHSKNEEK